MTLNRKEKFTLLLVFFVCLFLTPNLKAESQNEPPTQQILGGEYLDLQLSAVALITSSQGVCTGILVGERHVLTAAHCVTGPTIPVSDFLVAINGTPYLVSQSFWHPLYSPFQLPGVSAPYDLGLLILSSPVYGMSPAPVMYEYPTLPGDLVGVFGYGTNELSGLPILANGKGAYLMVSQAYSGKLVTYHGSTGASTCHGDSGGPLVRSIGNYSALVGTVSAGTNWDDGDVCRLGGYGESIFADLQSATSQQFLASFSGINWVSGRNMVFQSVSEDLELAAITALQNRKLKKIKKPFKSIVQSLRALRAFADTKRMRILKRAQKAGKNVRRQKTKRKAKRAAKRTLRFIRKLVSFGVERTVS